MDFLLPTSGSSLTLAPSWSTITPDAAITSPVFNCSAVMLTLEPYAVPQRNLNRTHDIVFADQPDTTFVIFRENGAEGDIEHRSIAFRFGLMLEIRHIDRHRHAGNRRMPFGLLMRNVTRKV